MTACSTNVKQRSALWRILGSALLITLPLGLTACARDSATASYGRVQAETQRRLGESVPWQTGAAEETAAEEKLQSLLQQDALTSASAVRIALLNNRHLRATYAQLGVSQAALVQAGLLRNPLLDASYKFNLSGPGGELELGLLLDFVDTIFIPARRHIAAAELQAAEWSVTEAVLDTATQTRQQWIRATADLQRRELVNQIVTANAAALAFAQRLHDAGNITDLELEKARAADGEARLERTHADLAQLGSREALVSVLGLWGKDADALQLKLTLPQPGDPPSSGTLEPRVIESNLGLARGRSQLEATARRAGVTDYTALIADAEAGGAAQREAGGHWSVGPAISLRLPLFDWGGARRAAARAELQTATDTYYAQAVEVRSAARLIWAQLAAAQARVRFDREIKLPLQTRMLRQTQLEYNGMQRGTAELLEAHNAHVRAQIEQVDDLEAYWLARAEYDRLLAGGSLMTNEGSNATEGHEASW